jgi:hypothetical protein
VKELGGRFARYHGRLYRANATSDLASVLLIAYGETPPEPNFESRRPGIWRTHAPRTELDEYYEVRVEAGFRGLGCAADQEDDNGRLWLLYLAGDSYAAEAAGFKQIDYGVWGRWVDRAELDDLGEVRKDLLTP